MGYSKKGDKLCRRKAAGVNLELSFIVEGKYVLEKYVIGKARGCGEGSNHRIERKSIEEGKQFHRRVRGALIMERLHIPRNALLSERGEDSGGEKSITRW